MNSLIDILAKFQELQRLAHEGADITDIKLETIMQSIENLHGQDIDRNIFLDDNQKKRRKELYARAVREIKIYCKQVIKDETEIRRRLM